MAADLVVFDPDTIARRDAGGGRRPARRGQAADPARRGIAATVVNGEILLRDGKHTGALPGRLLRGPLARAGA